MTTVAHVLQDFRCSKEVRERRSATGDSVHFHHSHPEPTQLFCSSFIFALLLLSNLHLQAYSIPEIVAKTKPAVVEIVAMDEKGSPTTLGTGFFVSSDGLVVTNFHVIKGAASITAVNNNGAIFLLERLVAQPTGVDLAILKFRANDVPFLKLGTSTTAVEGQKVIVIGNPTGLTGSVSDGIISAFRDKRTMIQITAPISPAATLQSVGGQNLNFAIAVENVSAGLLLPPSEQPSGRALSTATPTPATGTNAYLESGRDALRKRNYDEAISDFTEAIRLDPNYALAYLYRGGAYDSKGNHEKAITELTEAIRLDPKSVFAYVARGYAYSNDGNLEKAISDYNEAIRLDPNASLAYYNRGNAYYNQGSHEKAIRDFTEAIRLDPHYALAYVNRGCAYFNHGNLEKAISDYNEAIRLDPNSSLAYNNRGNAYSNDGNLEKAISDYNQAIRLDPNYAFAYYNRGNACGPPTALLSPRPLDSPGWMGGLSFCLFEQRDSHSYRCLCRQFNNGPSAILAGFTFRIQDRAQFFEGKIGYLMFAFPT
jgi:Tfp pilus assembly protein PilF